MTRTAWRVLLSAVMILPAYGADTTPREPLSVPEVESDDSAVSVETFTGPRPLDIARPRYPREQIHRDQEGWVRLNFMVDTQGEPYEIVISDAVGDKEFERAAIRALRDSVFQPARLNGQPIEAGHALTYRFLLKGRRPAARRVFVSRYRGLTRAVESGDRAGAERFLQDLEAENLYENAYLELGKFLYHQRWGTREQQLTALRRALGHAEDPAYLPDALFEQALQALFTLQLEVQDFAGALRTADRLQELELDEDLRGKLETATKKIRALQADDRPFSVAGTLGDSSTSWFLWLLRREFRLDQVVGRVSELKLRCAGHFVGFVYDPELEYRISERYMPCLLEVVGDPGTTFRLIQS